MPKPPSKKPKTLTVTLIPGGVTGTFPVNTAFQVKVSGKARRNDTTYVMVQVFFQVAGKPRVAVLHAGLAQAAAHTVPPDENFDKTYNFLPTVPGRHTIRAIAWNNFKQGNNSEKPDDGADHVRARLVDVWVNPA